MSHQLFDGPKKKYLGVVEYLSKLLNTFLVGLPKS